MTDERKRSETGEYVETVKPNMVLDALAMSDDPVMTTKEVGKILGCTSEAARQKLGKLYEVGKVERKEVGARAVVWWTPAPDADTVLRRLSNELGEPITLADGTVFEDGDKHPMDE